MPDDLLSGEKNQNQSQDDNGGNPLDDQSEKSPLEEAMEKVPEEPINQQPEASNPIPPAEAQSQASPIPNEPVAAPSEPPKDIEAKTTPEMPDGPSSTASENPALASKPEPNPSETPMEGEESAKAPDTDEFLKSILDEHPSSDSANQAEPPAAPPSEQTAPQAPEIPVTESSGFKPATEEPPTSSPTPPQESLSQAPETPQPAGFSPEVKSDTGSMMDGISTASTSPEQPAVPSEPAGMEMPPVKPSASPTKLIILIVVAAILVVGGYFAYTLLFANKGTESTSKTSTSATVTSTVSQSSNDEIRKADLVDIQQALLNYYAGTGQYPVAASLVYLNATGNVVEKALVPAYLNALPADPSTPTKNYAYKSDGKTFTLTAVLDNTSDSDGVKEGDLTLYKVTQATQASSNGSLTTSQTPASASKTPTVSATRTVSQ